MNSWSAAAAVLLLEGKAMHYDSLTARVEGSGLSGLGSRGGMTLAQTLGSAMRSKPEIFGVLGGRRGLYVIKNPSNALSYLSVRQALKRLLSIQLEEYNRLLMIVVSEPIGHLGRDSEILQRLRASVSRLHQVSRLYGLDGTAA